MADSSQAFRVGPGRARRSRGRSGAAHLQGAREPDRRKPHRLRERDSPGRRATAPPAPRRGRVLVRDRGELRFRLGERTDEAREGSFVFVPRGVEHAFTNPGSEPVRILVGFTPAGMEAFFDGLTEARRPSPASRGFRELGPRRAWKSGAAALKVTSLPELPLRAPGRGRAAQGRHRHLRRRPPGPPRGHPGQRHGAHLRPAPGRGHASGRAAQAAHHLRRSSAT